MAEATKLWPKTRSLIPLYNETTIQIEENREYRILLTLKSNILKLNMPQWFDRLSYLIFIFSFWLFLVIFLELSKSDDFSDRANKF